MSKYISLENLERYDAKMQERAASFCASKEDGMWRQTEKAGAVSFWPVGNSPLEGTVEFMFKETPPANGQPKAPDNPSTITGVSSVRVTRCGKNLVPPNLKPQGNQYNIGDNVRGIVTKRTEDKRLILNGTPDSNGYYNYIPICYFPQGLTYTLSGFPITNDATIFAQIYGTGSTTRDYGRGVSYTQTAPQTTGQLLTVRLTPNSAVSNLVWSVQLELGSEITEYEEPISNVYTIQLGNTYYGGSIDLATGLMTVTWWGHVFDGTETWRENGTAGTNYRHWVRLSENGFPDPVTGSAYQLCSHCTYYYSFNASLGRFFANNAESSGGIFFDDKDAVYPSTESWVNWLASEHAAGHPVVVTYQLTTPTTIQLTPPQILALAQPDKYVPRLNTVYTDAENVQIVYQKNPVRDKFEKVQAIIAQGGNV